jgi:hypothetical protein
MTNTARGSPKSINNSRYVAGKLNIVPGSNLERTWAQVDPQLRAALEYAASQSPSPVAAFEGRNQHKRNGVNTWNHTRLLPNGELDPMGYAIDLGIYDENGKLIPNGTYVPGAPNYALLGQLANQYAQMNGTAPVRAGVNFGDMDAMHYGTTGNFGVNFDQKTGVGKYDTSYDPVSAYTSQAHWNNANPASDFRDTSLGQGYPERTNRFDPVSLGIKGWNGMQGLSEQAYESVKSALAAIANQAAPSTSMAPTITGRPDAPLSSNTPGGLGAPAPGRVTRGADLPGVTSGYQPDYDYAFSSTAAATPQRSTAAGGYNPTPTPSSAGWGYSRDMSGSLPMGVSPNSSSGWDVGSALNPNSAINGGRFSMPSVSVPDYDPADVATQQLAQNSAAAYGKLALPGEAAQAFKSVTVPNPDYASYVSKIEALSKTYDPFANADVPSLTSSFLANPSLSTVTQPTKPTVGPAPPKTITKQVPVAQPSLPSYAPGSAVMDDLGKIVGAIGANGKAFTPTFNPNTPVYSAGQQVGTISGQTMQAQPLTLAQQIGHAILSLGNTVSRSAIGSNGAGLVGGVPSQYAGIAVGQPTRRILGRVWQRHHERRLPHKQ